MGEVAWELIAGLGGDFRCFCEKSKIENETWNRAKLTWLAAKYIAVPANMANNPIARYDVTREPVFDEFI